ncbi:MAG: CBS domain-containing protein [Candidatus Sericytochromatia bacterium]|nr:CBS domain-containing protein [Candidatus Sericytochromatia bacterium]
MDEKNKTQDNQALSIDDMMLLKNLKSSITSVVDENKNQTNNQLPATEPTPTPENKMMNKNTNLENHENVNEEKPAPNDERLRVEQINSQEGRVMEGIPAISAVTSIRPIQAKSDPVNFADALEQWRYMSEKYRNKRLAKEKNGSEFQDDVNSQSKVLKNSPNNSIPNNPDLLTINKFQNNYEYDTVQLSPPHNNLEQNPTYKPHLAKPNQIMSDKKVDEKDKKHDFRDKIIQSLIQRLSNANIEVDPALLEEGETNEIEPSGDILKVSDVMTKNVVSVIDSMTIEQVASIFNKRRITGVPVINYHSKQPIGIISMSDIISHIFDDGLVSTFPIEGNNMFQQDTLAILDKPISELMHTEIIETSIDTTVKDACNLMIENDIHRVLVTQNNKVKGIFTSFDAVRILAKFDVKIN